MHRFFVTPDWIQGGHARLEGDAARQVSHVLRLSPGDHVTLLDNSGKEYVVRLTVFHRGAVEGEVISLDEGSGEPSLKLTLYQGMVKGEKFEWVLQKGTELGVTAFVPVNCQRSVIQARDSWSSNRYARWRRIITEAAEQSGRSLLPQLGQPMSFEEVCEGIEGRGASILPWEQERATPLRAALRDVKSRQVDILIGPEGGFEQREVAHAHSRGVVPVSLGRRILRSETAAIVTVAVALYELGENES